MEALYRLKDLLCDEVAEIVHKNDITPTELDRVYKVVDIIKDIDTIDAMENADFTKDYSYDDGMSHRRYDRGRSSYDRGYSGRRMYATYSYDNAPETKEHLMQKMADIQRQIDQM